MERIEGETISKHIARVYRDTIFVNCRFSDPLPDFYSCELYSCNLSNCKIRSLIDCKIFDTIFDDADFSSADVRFSLTSGAAPCSAKRCNWTGVAMILDCSFLNGLNVGDSGDEFLFLVLALIPQSTNRKKLINKFTPSEISRAKALLAKPFRRTGEH